MTEEAAMNPEVQPDGQAEALDHEHDNVAREQEDAQGGDVQDQEARNQDVQSDSTHDREAQQQQEEKDEEVRSDAEDEPSGSQPSSSSFEESIQDVAAHVEEAVAGAALGAATVVLNDALNPKVLGDSNGASPAAIPAQSPHTPTSAAAHHLESANADWTMLCVVSVVMGLLVLLFLRRLLGAGTKRRSKSLLVGLPSSGKTALFSQLTAGRCTESRTSMTVNTGTVCLEGGAPASGVGTALVDCPGHRRLRSLLYTHLAEATNVIVTVDAVTVHDDQHEGALAVSALLLNLIESPAFYGVKRLLIVATKRDELTSYSLKAVRKLLEAAMVRTITARQGELNRVDKVVDVAGGVVTAGANRRGAGKKMYLLDVNEDGSFSFDQIGLEEVSFAEVSSLYSKPSHDCPMSVEPVRNFILRR